MGALPLLVLSKVYEISNKFVLFIYEAPQGFVLPIERDYSPRRYRKDLVLSKSILRMSSWAKGTEAINSPLQLLFLVQAISKEAIGKDHTEYSCKDAVPPRPTFPRFFLAQMRALTNVIV